MKKKAISFLLAFSMVSSFIGLSSLAIRADESKSEKSEAASSEEKSSEAKESAKESGSEDAGVTTDGKFEIALVTDVGTIDDRSFNQGSWEGVVKYAEENKVSHKYYRPTEQSDAAYEQAIDLAVQGGAKVIVCPGFLFEVPVFKKAQEHKDVHFVLIDGVPHDTDKPAPEKPFDNVIAINYKEEESGFLAGYAAVQEGYRKLGFMGGIAVPAVVRFGYGYLQGIEAAAKDLNLKKDEVHVKYNYTGSFEPKPEIKSQAASWYNDGTEVIFSCGGGIGVSIMSAAENAKKFVIGVDVDQYEQSPSTVITSAMKNLQLSVYEAVKSFYDKKWKGEVQHLGAKENMVLISLDHDTFKKFDKKAYEELYKKLQAGDYKITPMPEDKNGSPVEFKAEHLTLDFVE